jgi:excisionase family DNA binding protein
MSNMPRATVVPEMPSEGFLTVAEIAKALRLSQFTIRRWIWSGKLKAKLFGNRMRVPVKEYRALVEGEDWSPALCQQRTARPRARRRRPKALAQPSPGASHDVTSKAQSHTADGSAVG